MYNLILGIVIVLSIVMVIAIMMQPSKQNSAASAFKRCGSTIRQTKARGFEAVMQRSTAVMGAVWMILLFVLAFLSSK